MATITWRRVRGAKIMTTVLVAAEINIKEREGAEGNSRGAANSPHCVIIHFDTAYSNGYSECSGSEGNVYHTKQL